jgi:hypothetical protein
MYSSGHQNTRHTAKNVVLNNYIIIILFVRKHHRSEGTIYIQTVLLKIGILYHFCFVSSVYGRDIYVFKTMLVLVHVSDQALCIHVLTSVSFGWVWFQYMIPCRTYSISLLTLRLYIRGGISVYECKSWWLVFCSSYLQMFPYASMVHRNRINFEGFMYLLSHRLTSGFLVE